MHKNKEKANKQKHPTDSVSHTFITSQLSKNGDASHRGLCKDYFNRDAQTVYTLAI